MVAFGKLQHVMKNREIPIKLKRKIYESYPVTTYGLETIAFTKKYAETTKSKSKGNKMSSA